MDDFLHNLRSGKLKQHNHFKRPYSGQRRPAVDRRKNGDDNLQVMSAVKDVLIAVNETLKSIAATQESLVRSEERTAMVLEMLADNFHSLIKQATVTEVPETAPKNTGPKPVTVQKLTESAKSAIFDMTRKMRKAGDGWEKIARDFSDRGYPTVSGKGKWRGVSVKSLYEKMGES